MNAFPFMTLTCIVGSFILFGCALYTAAYCHKPLSECGPKARKPLLARFRAYLRKLGDTSIRVGIDTHPGRTARIRISVYDPSEHKQ